MEIEIFDKWNNLKKEIHFWNEENNYPKSGEVWYINNWINIWFESNWKWEDFKRPVLVLKKIGSLFFVITMTTKWKDNIFFYKLDDNYFWKDSYLTLSQIKSIDKKRFIEKIWKLTNKDLYKIKKELQNFLF